MIIITKDLQGKYITKDSVAETAAESSQAEKDEIDAFLTSKLSQLPNGQFLVAKITKDGATVKHSIIRYHENNKLKTIKE